MSERFATPRSLFGEHYAGVIERMSAHSPFPAAQGSRFGVHAKIRAATIHLEETIFFAELAYADLHPTDTVELCAGFGIPSVALAKLHGVRPVCVDADSDKMKVGADIAGLIGVTLIQEEADLFSFLRSHADWLKGRTLLATAAYCRDTKSGGSLGSGEREIVAFAADQRINLALLPFRSGEVLRTGISGEKQRIDDYETLLSSAGYDTRRHSTRPLFGSQGAPEWFFLDILTGRSR